jgi:methylthioribulose-1-phosphate dehydratase
VSESLAQIAASLSETAAEFHSRGWVLGTSGNLSAVVERNPLRLAITPSGVDKGAIKPEQIIAIDEQAQVLGDMKGKPSDESPLHIRIAQERLAGAVFHTHSVWSTMLSDLHFDAGGVTIAGYEMLKGLEGVKTHEHHEWVPILPNSQDMWVLADRVTETLRQHPPVHGFLLHRHGLYAWGQDRWQAKRHVEIFEFLFETLARTYLIEQVGSHLSSRWHGA